MKNILELIILIMKIIIFLYRQTDNTKNTISHNIVKKILQYYINDRL